MSRLTFAKGGRLEAFANVKIDIRRGSANVLLFLHPRSGRIVDIMDGDTHRGGIADIISGDTHRGHIADIISRDTHRGRIADVSRTS